jgi:Ca2+-binding RTX toxin-like protein
MAVFVGTVNAEQILGSTGNDVISGLGGHDRLYGLSGIDVIRGGEGNDAVNGGSGADSLYGDAGDDVLDGGSGNDLIDGGVGNDVIDGGGQSDRIFGGLGNDTIYGADFDIGVFGGGGGATISGGVGDDVVIGGGLDKISGDGGNDRLSIGVGSGDVFGGTGNDIIVSANFGVVDGGAGNDLVVWADESFSANEILHFVEAQDASGIDAYDFSRVVSPSFWGSLMEPSGVRADLRSGHHSLSINRVIDASASPLTVIENVVGSGLSDILIGNQAANTLSGANGGDIIFGEAGNDVLNGGSGDDSLYGDSGPLSALETSYGFGFGFYADPFDLFGPVQRENYAIAVTTTDRTSATSITVTVVVLTQGFLGALDSVDFTLNGVEVLSPDLSLFGAVGPGYLVGSFEITGLSPTADDTLDVTAFYADAVNFTGAGSVTSIQTIENAVAPGLAGNDVLDGGVGNDVMTGGAGNDVYIVNVAADVVVEDANAGTDRIESTVSRTLETNVENLTLLGSSGVFGTGNGSNNVIIGNLGNNILKGLDGNDTIQGGGGNDTLEGGVGLDALTGGIGTDRFSFGGATFGRDTIADFTVGVDDLVVDASGFGGGLTAAASLAADRLVIGPAGGTPTANAAKGQFLYDRDDGRLLWDVDGSAGSAAIIHIATLTGAPLISGTDFIVVA